MSKNGSVTAETHRAVKRKVANLRAELMDAEALLEEARMAMKSGSQMDFAVMDAKIGLFLARLEQRV